MTQTCCPLSFQGTDTKAIAGQTNSRLTFSDKYFNPYLAFVN